MILCDAVDMSHEDRRRASTDARIELRKQALRLREQGATLAEISEITGYKVPYLSTMLRAIAADRKQVAMVRRGGRPKASGRALTLQQERQVQDWVCRRCPDQMQLPFALWTRKAVQTLIARQCGVKLSIRGVGEYLERWGYTPQRPIRRAYAPRGQSPLIRVPARRKSLSLISAITNQGKVRFMIYPGALRPRTLIKFMDRLIRDARRKVYLILDNLNVHKSRDVRQWLQVRREQIEVFHLPPYSPELNPDEYLNGDLKRAVQQDVPPQDAQQLKLIAQRHLRVIQRSRRRVRNYFRHHAIRYAA